MTKIITVSGQTALTQNDIKEGVYGTFLKISGG